MTSTKFATELNAVGFCIAGNRIVAVDCPGIAWKPVMKGGHIDRASTPRSERLTIRQTGVAMESAPEGDPTPLRIHAQSIRAAVICGGASSVNDF
jgi:hypothetical protein